MLPNFIVVDLYAIADNVNSGYKTSHATSYDGEAPPDVSLK